MVLEGECLVGLFDFLVGSVPIYLQYLVVILLLGLLFLLLGLLDLVLEVCVGVELLDLVVIHDGGSVFSAFHVEFCPSCKGFVVVGIEFERLVEVVECLEGFLAFHEGQCPVGVDNRVKFLVGRIQIDGLCVFLLRILEFSAFYQLVPLLLQLLALFGSVEGHSALLVVRVQSHAL